MALSKRGHLQKEIKTITVSVLHFILYTYSVQIQDPSGSSAEGASVRTTMPVVIAKSLFICEMKSTFWVRLER